MVAVIAILCACFVRNTLGFGDFCLSRGTSGRWGINHGYDRYERKRAALNNIYDDWRSDAVVDTIPLDEENVVSCLDEFVQSDYGKQMFGCHDLPASYGITGAVDFVEIAGPEVVLRLSGKFWHRRETVLGRAAMWLNARMPEIIEVRVEDMAELEDFEDVTDEFTGEVLYQEDKRAPDFNGDRETMEYQGIDPDMRGPFPQGVGGLRPGGSMINPS
eukprot:CAMPEP_0183308898 /NCGR_PEP_ID=MMETSP0160_2-20130417/22896_1 /TAXON_ID=2839 ORGANISM="Odontella Sinensis, Strain Grunow 1884" /NCGR_SAMPLE_ID=MMETSP0160_2 /ASSEMBLY_ACC=CAM_ASM_000250 /LENGTH=216 /DNA_ID=CAMNT_0025472815 /DNA_START=58 /DNA_END=708 /DNA_ORIENTATION=+